MKFLIKEIYEPGAGIMGFGDEVTITIHSGDPGEESGEFEQCIAECLRQWHEGAIKEIKLEVDVSRKPGSKEARKREIKAWCTPETSKIDIESTLVEAFVNILDDIKEL